MHCNQCEPVRINGIFCHEIGCPNMHKTWDANRGGWIAYKDCFQCGCPVEVGEQCDCTMIEVEE